MFKKTEPVQMYHNKPIRNNNGSIEGSVRSIQNGSPVDIRLEDGRVLRTSPVVSHITQKDHSKWSVWIETKNSVYIVQL